MPPSLPASHLSTPGSPPEWSLIIRPKVGWFDLQLSDLWHHRDLLWMFVRRDFVSVYKQTILGPIWFFIQPLLTTIMFTVIFSGVAKISTDGMPPMLFYLAGTTPWNYFSTCLTKTSGTFINNANLFGKVYFPRLVTPISIVVSNLIQFSIQFLLFFGFLAYYLAKGAAIQPDWLMIVLLTPAAATVDGLARSGYRHSRFIVDHQVSRPHLSHHLRCATGHVWHPRHLSHGQHPGQIPPAR